MTCDLDPKEARRLLRICTSARECHFHHVNGTLTKAVSVANRDSKRPEVVAILKGRTMLWPPGACNSGMVMWMGERTWYPIAARTRT
jgi:hypothetical protein